MSKNAYSYDVDEFDAPAPDGAPVGVHRAPRSGWSKTWPFLLVVVIFAGLAYGTVALISGFNATPPSDAGASPTETDSGTEVTPSTDPEPDPTTTPPPVETDPPVETETPEEPAADVQLGTAVRVLNGAGIAGLAGRGVDALTAGGFTNLTPANYTQDPLGASAIWYKTPELESTAREAAKLLGIDDVALVPELSGPISIILMTDIG